MRYKAIVMGISAGGMAALAKILPALPRDFPLPLMIVQHLHPHQGRFYVNYFDSLCNVMVKEADEKEKIQAGIVYFAPPNYHLLVEADTSLSLTVDEKVNFSRPSIDVLFESAADIYRAHLIGVVLTGANGDGALGLKKIKQNGGLAIVQDPEDAEVAVMPQAAIAATTVDYILSLSNIIAFFKQLGQNNQETPYRLLLNDVNHEL